jgi:hypothetical protein
MATSIFNRTELPAAERLDAMGTTRRFAAYLSGELSRHELHVWVALWPEEVPLINGELPWIIASLADLD